MTEPGKRAPDFVYDSIGEVGKWQVYILLIIAVSKFPVGWHQLSTVFLAPPVDYQCINPDNSTNPCSDECKEVEYDRSVFEETIITEWDLICTKVHLVNLAQTIFMLGILVGNVAFGVWSDKCGRRMPLVCSVLLQLVSGVLAAYSPWFWLFVLFRFLCALATGGSMITSFCLIMEIIGPSHRELLAGIVYQVPFFLGHLLLSPISYFLRHFRHYQFALSIFSAFLISYICLIPESPRWLMLKGRTDESVKILEKAAVWNKRPTDNIRKNVEDAVALRASKPEVKKSNVFDLLRTPNLRRNTLCIFYNWFAVGFNYFGVSQYVGQLGGNIFLNVALSALFGLPGVFMSAPACKYLGRKPTLAASNAIIGVCMFVFIFVPKDFAMVRVILASLGVFGGAMLFPTVYIYAGEIFPTVARNAGMGVASMIARIGAMLAAQASGLKEFAPWIPPFTFALVGLIAAVWALALPETKDAPLPETLEDAENFKKKDK